MQCLISPISLYDYCSKLLLILSQDTWGELTDLKKIVEDPKSGKMNLTLPCSDHWANRSSMNSLTGGFKAHRKTNKRFAVYTELWKTDMASPLAIIITELKTIITELTHLKNSVNTHAQTYSWILCSNIFTLWIKKRTYSFLY